MLNPKSLTPTEAHELFHLKRGSAHDSWGRIARRAGVSPEFVDKMVNIANLVALGVPSRENLERSKVIAVLEAMRRWNA